MVKLDRQRSSDSSLQASLALGWALRYSDGLYCRALRAGGLAASKVPVISTLAA